MITLLLEHYKNIWHADREIGSVTDNLIKFSILFLEIQLFRMTYTIFIIAIAFVKIRSLN